jgi:hypothetical protein
MKFHMNRLPPGTHYVMKPPPGYHYEVVVPAPVTLPAAERVPTLPDPSLTSETMTFIEREEEWLSEQPTEHFTAFYVDRAGAIVGASHFDEGTVRQEGNDTVHEIQINVSEVLREAERLGAAGVWTAHNHPGGTTAPTEADKTLSKTLTECLARKHVRLLASHIVPAQPQALTEAAPPFDSAYDVRVAEHQRLWAHRGGLALWEGRAR